MPPPTRWRGWDVQLTILVTGATDGLGRGVAAGLAADGARVLVHGRSRARIDDTIEEIRRTTGNDSSRGYLADLASLAEVRRLADDVQANEAGLDVLINNAGIGRGPTGAQTATSCVSRSTTSRPTC